VAGEIDGVRVVDDAIEDDVDVGWIVPFVDGDLTGDDGRSATMAFFRGFRGGGCVLLRQAVRAPNRRG
jgi:hypothetical protein